ncbi:MAG: phage head closure protein [Alphaproteobacteria bacterium]|nr:phage head closure protein [Alphaproteobacteria bacterium]
MFGIGTYRQRLYVQQENPVADTGGGNAMAWTTINTIWASIEPVSGNEQMIAGKPSGTVTHRIHTRYDATITPAMRLMLGSRIYNIRSIKNIQERNRVLEILAEEGVAT